MRPKRTLPLALFFIVGTVLLGTELANAACLVCKAEAGPPLIFACDSTDGNGATNCVATGSSCAATGQCTKPCFLEGTMISTPSGDRRIEDMNVGDLIYCSDPEGNVVSGRVLQTKKNHCDEYLVINSQIRVTPSHRFFARQKPSGFVTAASTTGDWLEAGALSSQHELRNLDGDWVPISSIEVIPGARRVYNFEVSPWANYFAHGLLVHNDKPDIQG